MGRKMDSGRISYNPMPANYQHRQWYKRYRHPTLKRRGDQLNSLPPSSNGLDSLSKLETTGDEMLFVGHEESDVTDRTLTGVYLKPLLDRLERNNKNSKGGSDGRVVGLYPEDPSAQVQLVIDMVRLLSTFTSRDA